MRNFEERKSEIFRRSEKRIKERKRKRNRLLAICIPLCIIATVSIIVGFSPKTSLQIVDEETASSNINVSIEMNCNTDKSETQANSKYISAKVKSNGVTADFHNEITDSVTVANVYKSISSAFQGDDADDEEVIGDDTFKNDTLKDFEGESEDDNGYTITIFTNSGEKLVYILKGNKLCDASNKIEVVLNDIQIAELKFILGI